MPYSTYRDEWGEASSLRTPPARLAELARHGHDSIRYRVAANTGTPSATLLELTGDPALKVLERLIVNPSAPIEVFVRLVEKYMSSERVTFAGDLLRSAIFRSPCVPPAVKMWLQGGYGGLSLRDFIERMDVDSKG